MAAYYNEIDPYAVQWLRNLIKAGLIADGEVDTRSIVDVQPNDIRHFNQCHFFAGIAGWSHALRLAGWSDDRKIWTGSCPCQPFSVAGKGKGTDDERHLWPHFFRLIRGCRPPVVMGEQVAGAAGYGWLDGVRSDLESESYAIEGVDIPACATNAPHIRQRLYWVANTTGNGRGQGTENARGLSERNGAEGSIRRSSIDDNSCYSDMADTLHERLEGYRGSDECFEQRNGCEHITEASISSDVVNSNGERLTKCVSTSVSVQTKQPSVECSSSRRQGNWESVGSCSSDMANTNCEQLRGGHAGKPISPSSSNEGEAWQRQRIWVDAGTDGNSFWHNAIWLNGADGKARRVGTDIRMLVDGFSASLGRLCPDKYAEAQQKVIDYASSIQTSSEETMREVWRYVWQEPEAVRPMGKCAGIYTQEILLTFLCQLSSACGASREFISCKEIEKDELRSLRNRSETSCTSCERQSIGQSSRKYSDALHELSWVLAQYAGEMWEAHKRENAKPLPLLMHGVPARVGKLRAYGNAIVPELAKEVIIAFMEWQNENL